ncbi:MAG: TolC family protein [Nitrospirae bacterium]|nr:TolC family protein [Candidatus Manganitrophaceae bacterium]
MIRRGGVFLLISGLILIGHSNVFAQRVVTLEEAYRQAMAESQQIGISRENLLQAEQEIDRAKSFLYPNVNTDANYQRRADPKFGPSFGIGASGAVPILPQTQEQFNLTLSQPLYTGGRATAAFRSAKLGVRGGRLDLSLTTENLLFEVARAYYEALKAQRNVEIEENEVRRLEAHLTDADKRFRVGEAIKTVVLRAQAELADARARLIRAKNDQATTLDQLALLARIADPFTLADPPSLTLSEKAEAEWVKTAHARRSDLERQSANIQISEEQIKIAKGTFFPTLRLEGRYNWLHQDPQTPFAITNDRSALLIFSFPVFEGRLRVAELAQARSRHRQTVLQKELLSDQIAVEVRRSLLNLNALTSEVDVIKAQVAFARENFALVSRQFAVGLATNIDVLDANAALISAERQLTNTTYDREVAILQVEKSVGVFLDLIPPSAGRREERSPPSASGPEKKEDQK